MNQQLTEEQEFELHRFNQAASQYAPGLYCSLRTTFCSYPAALGGEASTTASVQVTCYQHPSAANLNNAAVAEIPNADDFDAALLEMRRQLTARFGFLPDPDDLLLLTPQQFKGLKTLCEDRRITRPEKTLVLLNLDRMTRGQAKAKAAELQGFIDSRPLPAILENANPAALANIA